MKDLLELLGLDDCDWEEDTVVDMFCKSSEETIEKLREREKVCWERVYGTDS